MLLQEIVDFNRKNELLNFDVELEIKMLSEEAREFFLADNIVDRMDAVCDFIYVANGSEAKFFSMEHTNYDDLKDGLNKFSTLKIYIDETKKTLMGTIVIELEKRSHEVNEALAYKIINECLHEVIEANKQKLGAKKSSIGKVQKPKGFIPPEDRIRKVLQKHKII
jgi:hypothetical protein